MPAFYAHHRFGEEVAQTLDGKLAEIIREHRVQFDIGLQGPDIFFFYRPHTGGGRVAKYGHHLHDISAFPFFEHAMEVVERKGVLGKEGFICHYILDSHCHGYINDMVKKTGVQHLEIEEEFEKWLLRLDGENPVAYPLARLIPCDDETAQAICPFYEDMTAAIVKQTLLDLRRVKKLLTAPGIVKQGLINTAFRFSRHYGELKGLMHQRKDNPKCRETSETLGRLFEEAVPVAAEMMKCFDESLRTGQQLPERFDRNFL